MKLSKEQQEWNDLMYRLNELSNEHKSKQKNEYIIYCGIESLEYWKELANNYYKKIKNEKKQTQFYESNKFRQ